jgi:hypothetical protein
MAGFLKVPWKVSSTFHDVDLLLGDRRAVSAVEFAIGAPLFFLFLFGVIDLGSLGLSYYALNQGVISAARGASVEMSNGFAASPGVVGSASICPSQAHVQTIFDNGATPGIPAGVMPTISMWWGGSLNSTCPSTASPPSGSLPLDTGGWVQVSAQYKWTPMIGGYLFGDGFSINATATDQVMLAPSS